MNTIDPNSLLLQMRALAAKAQGADLNRTAGPDNTGTEFAQLMKVTLDKVNETQQNAGRLAQAFETGDKSVDIAQVMLAMQKSRVAFEAVTQVRNRLVSAYQDIMNMPI
jgi:flagellar hook-basal body complex protein FliE